MLINLGTYYIYLKLKNAQKTVLLKIKTILLLFAATFIGAWIKKNSNSMNCMIITILLLTTIFKNTSEDSLGNTIVATMISVAISNIIFFISLFLNSIPNILLKINNDYIAFIFISIIYILLVGISMNIKRIRYGFSFLSVNKSNDFMDIAMLNLSAVILFFMAVFGNYNILSASNTGICIFILSIIMFLTIKKSFDIYYKQKLLIKELEENKREIEQKNQEIKKLEEENLNFSKKSHSLAHKQKSLEYKINQLALKTELAEELDIKEQFKKLSKELYTEPMQELDKTNIVQIDDMLKFMQSECIKNDIEFRLQIYGNIYHIINNIITKDQLEILIADHVKDAIIAIKHTDNINKSILVKLGKIEGCYGLYIYDSGVEFKKEILENLGKKPSTAYPEEGGTGMGFMNTFDTLKGCNGSLIIKELGKLSKDNYTKIIMIKFDGKNEFKVVN